MLSTCSYANPQNPVSQLYAWNVRRFCRPLDIVYQLADA